MSKLDEPGYTCSSIDSAKDLVLNALAELDKAVSSISDLGSGRSCVLEDLRNSNAELRAWGQSWKEEAEKFESELEEMRDERDKFETLYHETYSELSDLRTKLGE